MKRVSESLQKYIAKIFGKDAKRKDGDYKKCPRCRNRFKALPDNLAQEPAGAAIEQTIEYDRTKFCSLACAVPKPQGVAATRPYRRHELRMRAQREIKERFPGESRRQRRRVARNLAKTWFKQEKKQAAGV